MDNNLRALPDQSHIELSFTLSVGFNEGRIRSWQMNIQPSRLFQAFMMLGFFPVSNFKTWAAQVQVKCE